MNLKYLAHTIFKHKYKIIVFLLASLVAVVFALRQKVPTYEATAQILVKVGREISAPSQDIIGSSGYVIQKRREDIYAEEEILKSVYLIEEVVRELGPDKILSTPPEGEAGHFSRAVFSLGDIVAKARKLVKSILSSHPAKELTSFEQAVLLAQRKLAVTSMVRSDTIFIGYSHVKPELAKEILNVYLSRYLERHIEVHKGASMQALFQPEADTYRKNLEEIERKLEVLRNRNNIFSMDDQKRQLIQQKAEVRKELDHIRRNILVEKDQVDRMKEQISSHNKTVEMFDSDAPNPLIQSLKTRLVELQMQKQTLLHNYSPKSRKVAVVVSEINTLNTSLAEEQARILYTNENELSDLQLREKSLKQELMRHVSELKAINDIEIEKERLEREKQINERNYLRYMKELEEARISEVMDLAKITNVRVIQPVAVSLQQLGMRNSLILAVVGCISLLIGVCIVFLLEYLDHSIGTARDIEEFLDLPVLGSIREKR